MPAAKKVTVRRPSPPKAAKPAPAQPETPRILEQYACYKIIIKPSEIHRWGVFAGEAIPKGRKIIEYTGERISRRETARRADGPLNYLFTLDSYWTLDGSVGGSGAQYINHCCEPNCHAWIYRGHILYMASRDIRKGEELTIDYHFDPDVPEVKCGCGATNCRGTINLKKVRKKKVASRHV
jgi:SET domain-containing protein